MDLLTGNNCRYFNHASFASLRRQLNYFNFTRIGKGRQRGATYCNEAVIELSDILRLKRKSVTHAAPGASVDRLSKELCGSNVRQATFQDSKCANALVPFLPLAPPSEDDYGQRKARPKKRKLNVNGVQTLSFPHLSPVPHSVSDDDTPGNGSVLSGDLSCENSVQVLKSFPSLLAVHLQSTEDAGVEDEDILAGCSVLLSFCRAKMASAGGAKI